MALASDLITDIRGRLSDETPSYRWPDAELLRYISAGQRQIVTLVPEANTTEALFTLTADARQLLGSQAIKFIKATSNYYSGVRRGLLRAVEKDALDTNDPDWENTAGSPADVSYFKHYTHDPREPRVFHVYPKPYTTGQQIYVVYSVLPLDITSTGGTIDLTDAYRNATVEYAVYLALSREGRFSMSPDKTQNLYNNFLRALGMRIESDRRVSPDQNKPPAAP